MPSNLDKWHEIERRLLALGALNVRLGVLQAQGGSDIIPEGTLTICELAAIHEFGAANVPERSFIRFTLENNRDEIRTFIERLSALFVAGKVDAERALKILGEKVVALVKANIVERKIKQDLAPETIARKRAKGRDPDDATTALVDTGQLKNAITYVLMQTGRES